MKHIVLSVAPENLKRTEQDGSKKFTGVDWNYTKVSYDAQTKLEVSRILQPEEFHSIVDDDYDHKEAVYCAQWDGKSDKLTVLVGSSKTLTHKFLGWPDGE